MTDRLARIAPGLIKLLSYSLAEDFRHDLLAGVSVAAVALPVAIAYAQLAGFNPVVGLYSSILPLVAYAIFGTSRQLVVNPDAAVCAMIAAAVAPLARGDSFSTISAHGPNAALPHYRTTPETNRRLDPGTVYLVDSGGQYLDATTDITRTIGIG